MGMFDSIFLDIKCPYCNAISEIECQTKELDSMLMVWRKNDDIGTKKFNYLSCIADCRSYACKQENDKKIGYISGFGQMFDIEVYLDNGIVTGGYNIILPDDEITRKVRIEKNNNESY